MALYKFRLGAMLELKRQGAEVIAIAPEDIYSEKLVQAGIRFLPVNVSAHHISPLQDVLFFLQLLRIYLRLKPSAIVHFTVKPNIFGNLAAWLAGRIPSFSMVPGRGFSFHKKNWLYKLVRASYRFSLRQAREVWFLNEEDRLFFVEEGMVAQAKTVVLPGEGVDTGYYAPLQPGGLNGNHPFTFLLSGRMMWEKGVGEFVEAARIVKKRFPHAQFQLLGFLDDGDDRVVPSKTIAQWEQEGTVSYLGHAVDVRSYFAKADCFVLPSYYGEGLPRTLLEAASMEIPLIATDHRGCRRAVENGQTGFLCQPRNVADLAEKMLAMMGLPEYERKNMGRRGRQRVVEQFEEQLLVDFYLNKLLDFLPVHQATPTRRVLVPKVGVLAD